MILSTSKKKKYKILYYFSFCGIFLLTILFLINATEEFIQGVSKFYIQFINQRGQNLGEDRTTRIMKKIYFFEG